MAGGVSGQPDNPLDTPLAHTGRRASVYEGNPAQNKSTWQKARPFNDLTDTPVKNALEAEAAKVKRTTSRKVARTLVPKKDVKSA